MKSYHKNISNLYQAIFFIIILVFLPSCEMLEVEENFSVKVLDQDVPSVKVRFGESSDFNLSSAEGSFIDLILESTTESSAAITIYARINDPESAKYEIVTVESLPAEITLDVEDLREAVGEEINLENGDQIYLTFKHNGNEEDFQFNGTALTSRIICNSMISTAEDTWQGEAFADNGGSFPTTATAENVTIIPLADDQYLISDISAGWFDAIGFRPVQEGIYQDDCNTLTWVSVGDNFQFNFDDPEIEGSYDPVTETLTVYWFDPGNDFRGEAVFTKN